MKLWLSGNVDAHPFIPKEYWESNFSMVEEQILQAEVFLCETDGEIQGFIGIVGNYIAGIFVDKKYRSLGIGKQLWTTQSRSTGLCHWVCIRKTGAPPRSISGKVFQYIQKNLTRPQEKWNTP